MNVANIISIIGNNSSATPILVKDGIESTAKVYLANQQGQKVSKEQGFYEAREAAIEEFGTSGIWFFAPIAIEKAFNFVAKNVLKLKDDRILNTDSKLLDGKHYQTLEKNIKDSGDEFLKSDAKEFAKQSNLVKKLSLFTKSRYFSGIALTIGMLGGLTIMKQRITEDSLTKNGAPQGLSFQRHVREKIAKHPTFAAFTHKKSEGTSTEPSFKGAAGGIAELAKQASIDAGIGAVRVKTARDKDEKKEYTFKTITFILFNYLTAHPVEWAFNKIAKAAKLPIGLDPRVLADKNFADDVAKATQCKDAKAKMLDFVKVDKNAKAIDKEKQVIDFIDEQIKKAKYDKNGNFEKFNNATLELARKTGLIAIENKKRAATKFIDTKQVYQLNKHLHDIVESASGNKSVQDFVKKAKMTKYGAVLANIAICSTIVGVVLPKMQYKFREKGIGTVASPGVKASNHHTHPGQPAPQKA